MICGTSSEKTITNNNVFITGDEIHRQSLVTWSLPRLSIIQIKETTSLIMEQNVLNDYERIKNIKQ